MRQKADKLEKGKWYADLQEDEWNNTTFLKFKNSTKDGLNFSEKRGRDSYRYLLDGVTIGFPHFGPDNFYLPTPEDIEKYNLNEQE